MVGSWDGRIVDKDVGNSCGVIWADCWDRFQLRNDGGIFNMSSFVGGYFNVSGAYPETSLEKLATYTERRC